jgi:hypothetical protein
MTIPAPTPAHTADAQAAQVRARIRDLQLKGLDVADRILDSLQAEPAERAPLPLTVARRQMANMLGVPQLCHRARCRRTQTCDGEPAHCLGACLPALPHDVLARILSAKAMRQRLRRR